jgi:hypothetical protein
LTLAASASPGFSRSRNFNPAAIGFEDSAAILASLKRKPLLDRKKWDEKEA